MTQEATAGARDPAVEIRFDPDQGFQVRAVDSVVELFEGQSTASTRNELGAPSTSISSSFFSEHGFGNQLTLDDSTLASNLAAVQESNEVPADVRGPEWGDGSVGRDFTVEMETGTGKTYVYLRTIFELNRTYGWDRFVIIVPSLAIREGVEASIRLLDRHFQNLFGGVSYDAITYDSKSPGRVRSFAQTGYLQIMIVNIDAINKPASNKIFQPQDEMMGHAPIDFIRAAQPILILDEPQNMESSKAREALEALNPLFRLRYSATHLESYHQIYRLTPADAYRLSLVKQIEVWSVLEEENLNRPHIRLVSVPRTGTSIKARLELDCANQSSIKRKTVTVRADSGDLRELTKRAMYEGYVVEAIHADRIEFANGETVWKGQVHGANRDQVQRVQLREAIRHQLDHELRLRRLVDAGEIEPTKSLTLIFIDRVDNYWPEDAPLRTWFEEEYNWARRLPKYSDLDLPAADTVHGGYFARDRKGSAKDTTGRSEADREAYELIMRDKQRLLSLDEPLRFIFSHSALREGWDNPNVFTIATLAESHSELKKRQEIGRGLRLPVMSDGHRCDLADVAVLRVIANESYSEFAAKLQQEIEDETGSEFESGTVRDARTRRTVELNEDQLESPQFQELWAHIARRTTFQVQYQDRRFLERAAERLHEKPTLEHGKIRATGARLELDSEDGVMAEAVGERAPVEVSESYSVGDLIGQVAEENRIGREAAARIISLSGRMGEAPVNPQQFLSQVREAIQGALSEMLAQGVVYRRRPAGDSYEASLLAERPLTAYDENAVPVKKSVYAEVVVDSDLEREIAAKLNLREDVLMFLKLPPWFTVDTPIGSYNPDWAYLRVDEDGERHCFVRESKPTRELERLRPGEKLKIEFAKLHFAEIGANFDVIDDPSQA